MYIVGPWTTWFRSTDHWTKESPLTKSTLCIHIFPGEDSYPCLLESVHKNPGPKTLNWRLQGYGVPTVCCWRKSRFQTCCSRVDCNCTILMHYANTNLGTNTMKLTTPSKYAIGTFGQYHLLVFRTCRVKFLNKDQQHHSEKGRLLDKMTTQVVD